MTPQEAETERTGVYVFAMALCVAGAIGAAAYSGYHWLRYGRLATITLATIADPPHPAWRGLGLTIGWLWAVPLWLILIVTAMAIVFWMNRK